MNVTGYTDELKKKLMLANKAIDHSYENSIDIIATQQLLPLINALPYLPYTRASLRFSSITYFLNDIILNNRKVVVEFGAGISTIMLSKLIKQLSLHDLTLISIDNSGDWLNIIREYMKEDHSNFGNFQLLEAELTGCELSLNSLPWYNTEKLKLLENYRGQVDCVLVDGPEAWQKKIEYSRYPALPFVHDMLAPGCSVFLDDTNRPGEKAIASMWADDYQFKKEQLNNSFTRLLRGTSLNIK